MGTMLHGACHCCDRTSPLVDRENMWCGLCANDPERRKQMNDKQLATLFAWFVILFLVGGLMFTKYLWWVGHCQ